MPLDQSYQLEESSIGIVARMVVVLELIDIMRNEVKVKLI
jgi:hypothetical protein